MFSAPWAPFNCLRGGPEFFCMLNSFCRKNSFSFFMLNYSCRKQAEFLHVELFLPKGGNVSKNMLLSVEMLNVLNHVLCNAIKKTLLSAEIFNMLNMLNVLWPMRLHGVQWAKKHSTYSTYSTFQQKEHFFGTLHPTWFNMFNISAERSIFWGKKSFFLLKCWIGWMYWACGPKFLLNWRSLMGQKTFNIFNIFNISAERSFFLEPYIQHDSTYSIFQLEEGKKKRFFLLKCWICWMYWACGPKFLLNWRSLMGQKNIQHIQHIQHFSRKKHFLEP